MEGKITGKSKCPIGPAGFILLSQSFFSPFAFCVYFLWNAKLLHGSVPVKIDPITVCHGQNKLTRAGGIIHGRVFIWHT
jgi:hypothetical protein